MNKFLCFIVLAVFLVSAGCKSSRKKDEVPLARDVVEAPPPAPVVQPCAKLGSKINFNDQRILAFQKLVQLQILRIKALPMTDESTQELAKLETLRRRASFPLLTSSLRPQAVTKILTREAKNFSAFLQGRTTKDPQSKTLDDEINDRFLPLLENEEHWNCLEKPNDFEEDKTESEKT